MFDKMEFFVVKFILQVVASHCLEPHLMEVASGEHSIGIMLSHLELSNSLCIDIKGGVQHDSLSFLMKLIHWR